ncbi:Transcription factor bHLH96 [Heracleum sosnowskyi]|uniref:Transcription factor bHLH96 n=1 Tax=Heracleum sosnowskyi TaxID=360622 RepID=A0AAD8N8D2_9APIA|nr:Transcription factor bHLH96 [Heracleum sosnowskyi]
MALENVLFPFDSFCYGGKEFWSCDYILQQHEQLTDFSLISNKNVTSNNLQYEISNLHQSCSSSAVMIQDVNNEQLWGTQNDSSPDGANSCGTNGQMELTMAPEAQAPVTNPDRKRRRRTKSCKNKEEMESQRMTHIAVERNRRKQMNEYLAVIRSLMPTSYVQRNDQASIIGGAINYVKQLEKQLQALEAQQKSSTIQDNSKNYSPTVSPRLFSDFFAFPQYSTCTSTQSTASSENDQAVAEPERRAAVAAYGEIEVTVIESHANLKMLTKKRPKQLMKIVAGLQSMWLTILHVNVTTVEQMVLYTISLKIEEGCRLNTVNEIADGVNHLLAKIEEADV